MITRKEPKVALPVLIYQSSRTHVSPHVCLGRVPDRLRPFAEVEICMVAILLSPVVSVIVVECMGDVAPLDG
jgi:hypothetical protein